MSASRVLKAPTW